MAGDSRTDGQKTEDRHEQVADEARRDLERLGSQGEVVGTSAMARAAKKAGDHLSGADAPENDPIEIWGTRIGRGLGVVFFIGLVIYMAVTYL